MINLSAALLKLSNQAAWLEQEVEAATSKLLNREEEIIFRLSLAVEYRDNDTGGHTYRVARYSELLAEQLGLSPTSCRSIFLAAPLHDVGKVAIRMRSFSSQGVSTRTSSQLSVNMPPSASGCWVAVRAISFNSRLKLRVPITNAGTARAIRLG